MVCTRAMAKSAVFCLALCCSLLSASAASGPAPSNLFVNPSFEMGEEFWALSKARGVDAHFTLCDKDAADGRFCGEVRIGKTKSWGAQLGQTMKARPKGETCTFAAFAKAISGDVRVCLQIERRGKPYDRAARSKVFVLQPGRWVELHVTFTVPKDFPQGWFAYVSCTQPNAAFRVDAFRLYKGKFTPYEQAQKAEALVAGARLFDTGAALPQRIPAADMAQRRGWKQIPEDETPSALRGDAVVMNDRLALVVRRRSGGAALFSAATGKFTLRARVAATNPAAAAIKVIENSPSTVQIEASRLRYELQMGQPFVRVQATGDADRFVVKAPSRFVVMPDFFADDIVLDAREIEADEAELPGEHFLLHMLGRGDAVLMEVWKRQGADIGIELSGQGDDRRVQSAAVPCGQGAQIWLALIEAPGVWAVHRVKRSDAGKEIKLDWRAPFPARWRVDWRLDTGLVDSWEMAVEQPNGEFVRHAWFGQATRLKRDRKRWTSVLGRFKYPCWVDVSGRGRLQPLRSKKLKFVGPALIYPINRDRQTPLDEFTVVDVVRSALGVGPCQYVLDVEAQKTKLKGRPTCATRDLLNGIYARGEQKRKRQRVLQALDDVVTFVKFIRGRIEEYVAFGHKMRQYLQTQKRAHPDQAEFLDEMARLVNAIDEQYAQRKAKIKTPAYVERLTEKFRRTLLDAEGPDALARCKKITSAIVTVGGNQDALVGECRVAVKRLRQHAALAAAANPAAAPIAAEIRRRTQTMLRHPTSYEAPRY